MAVPTIPSVTFGEIGHTGLKQAAGTIHEEFLQDLQGSKGVRVFGEMWANSPIVAAGVLAITMLSRRVKWEIRANGNDDTAAFIDGAIRDLTVPFEDVIAEILQGQVVYGWHVDEIVYKRRMGPQRTPGQSSGFEDRMVGWRKFATRSQDSLARWEFDPAGGINGMWQEPMTFSAEVNTGVRFIPVAKMLLFRPEHFKDNPEGRSMLRSAYRPWFFAKRIEEIEGIGIERDLAGLPVIEVPAAITDAGASAEEQAVYDACKKLVKNIRRDEQMGVVLPQAYDENNNPLYKLSLLTSGGRRQIETDKVLQRYQMQIAVSMLADWLVLGHEKVGSFALASEKTELFAVALGTMLDGIASVFNHHAIPRLLRINGMDTDNLPTIEHGDLESINIVELATAIQRLANAGMPMFPDESLESSIRQTLHLPEIDESTREALLQEREDAKQEMRARQTERANAAEDDKLQRDLTRAQQAQRTAR